MASDHASQAFNSGRPVTDSALFYSPSQHLDALQFAYRWISHLCAPTFLFLAGTSLALSIERKKQRGVRSSTIDRDLLVRGLIILGVDLFFINWFWLPEWILLQVMYAIGLSMILMIPLRRLPSPALVVAGLATLGLGELVRAGQLMVPFEPLAVARTFLFRLGIIDTPLESLGFLSRLGFSDQVAVAYPVMPWWAMMALGWACGRYLRGRPPGSGGRSPAAVMAISGGVALLVFAALRGLNAYGNMELLRLDHSWIQWLHVSKYPPSITFVALELGMMALVLAGLFRLQDRLGPRVRGNDPVLLFGQTAFFFYVAHILFLEVAGRLLGMYQQRGLAEATVATVIVLVVLYPLCWWYRRYKAAHPRSFARYI
jgi:uncharacterized membrane protein